MIAALPAAPALAQETDDTDAVARQAPVFDLQPGETRPAPQPNVQGPRAPGQPAPRLLGQDEPDAVPAPVPVFTDTAPVATPPDSESAAADTASADATAPSARPPVPVSEAQAGTQDDATIVVPEAVPAQPAGRTAELRDEASQAETAPSESRPGRDGTPWWMWLIGLGILALFAFAGPRLARRRVREVEAETEPEPAAEPEAGPLPEPAATPVPGPNPVSAPAAQRAAKDAPSRVEIDFRPRTARLSTLGLTVGYQLLIKNISEESLRDITVRLGMRCADDAAMTSGAATGEPCLSLDRLEPGEERVHNGEIRLDPQTFRPLQSDGKPMLVPIVDMMPSYRDADGVLHEMHAAMLVGRELEPPRPKMQPFWLERGFGQFGAIGCRMLSVKTA